MSVHPETKLLNKIVKANVRGAEMKVNPPILSPYDSFIGVPKVKPGSLMWYRPHLNKNIKPEPFNSGADVLLGLEYEESKRKMIIEGFYNDLFLMLSDEKRRTATEIREIMAAKFQYLGPNYGRIKEELLDPKIGIILSIMEEEGYLKDIPIGYLSFTIRYISALALAMEYAELISMKEAMIFLSPFGEIDPTIWDNYSFDEISREIGEKMALPPKWLRSRDERDAMRQARMQLHLAQTQAQMEAQAVESVPKLQKKTEEGSPLAAMTA